ncbi:RecBCD enzyme subunit RecD [Sporomusa carbonis]|uniref:AAA domain-containing protein n=1 Tax=Sporomusa carbonis TaxID=3076075 RepID=UPI003A5F674A
MPANVIQIFEYLLALKNLTVPVVRDIEDYNDKLWWQWELPVGEGCLLYQDTKDGDAWLEVYKQVIEAPPEPPVELKEWIKVKGTEPDNPPQVHNSISKLTHAEKEELSKLLKQIQELKEGQLSNDDEKITRLKKRANVLKEKNEIFFHAEPERVTLWENWVDTQWKPWSKEMLYRIKVQRLYGELFALYQRLQREGDATEIIWGHGLLAWNVGGFRVCRPVLTTRVELQFDSRKGLFKLIPTSTGTLLELDMLSNVELPNSAHLVAMERLIQDTGINPWDEAITKPFLEELGQTLSANGNACHEAVSGRGIQIGANPCIYNAPVLFLRSRSGRQWQSELQGIIEEIRNGHYIPETIEALVTDDISNRNANCDNHLGNEQWRKLGEELLFPLPANEDQKEIVRRLSKNIGVVVQGPPGTGKSHTIVNLLSHLLAHGKRVLVTSQTERALRVLGDMIRTKLPDIAPLCVSVMGGDARSMQELDLSVSKISEGLDQMNVDTLEAEIEHLRKDLFECKRKIARIKTELGRASENENTKVRFAEQDFTPMQLADWLSTNQEEYGWLPDEIDDSVAIPISDGELIKLYGLFQELSREDIDKVLQVRPPLEKLPTPEAVHEVYSKLLAFKDNSLCREDLIKGWVFSKEANEKLSFAIKVVGDAITRLGLLNEKWLLMILDDIVHGENRFEYWQVIVTDIKEKIRAIRDIENRIAEFSVDFSGEFDIRQVKEDAEILFAEFAKNKKPSLIFRIFSGKKTLYILEKFKVNGSSLRSAEDVKVLLDHLNILEAKKRFVSKWNKSISIVDGPCLNENDSRVLQVSEKYLGLIEVAFSWRADYLNALNNIAGVMRPPGVLNWTDFEWINKYNKGLHAYKEQIEYKELTRNFGEISNFLKKGLSVENAHSSWGALYDAYRTGNINNWRDILAELRRLNSLEAKVNELVSLKTMLNSSVPRWIVQIENNVRSGNAVQPPSGWRQAWEWKRAETWLKKHFVKVKLEELYEQLTSAKDEESRLIQSLVSKSTWLEQNRRTTDRQRRSLRSWVQTIRRIGKGTGKYAAKHQADAKKEMAVCREAVPVWIMPLSRVIENFKPSAEPFDVVIVDESSQCDLFALSALFRAKRAVIVGDDRQISPEGVGKELSEIYNLIDRYLIDVPQKERFTLQDSLYDTALRVFPGQQIMLKEHFRCVPEIIQFSNDQFYGGSIEPLRIPSSERLTPPIVPVRVDDGFRSQGLSAINEPEAIALVNKITELCSKKEYENKTMGVISLQGKDQSYIIEQLLRDSLGEAEMIERRIICGDSYSFQGDERDIIFLSMVAAPNVRNGVLNKRTDEQRFNVAASRAKEQLWLFHSIDLKDLNPSCMRYRLLQYCLEPQRTQCEMEDAEEIFRRHGSSQFHKDVHRMIIARGYRAIPEFKVGTHPYRIDTVIEGMNARLAVECDGDEWHGLDRWEADLERQMILERVGWKFWRIRGSVFYRDKEKALQPLWNLLDSMGIRPCL